jgi:hypothetical protein
VLCSLASACTADDASDGGSAPAPSAMLDASPMQDASAQDSSAHPVTGRDAAMVDAATDATTSEPDANAPDAGGTTTDGGATGCIDGAIRWTSNGGLVAWRRAFYVTPCRTFVAEQDYADDLRDRRCENELPTDHGITADSIDDLIAHPDVQAAIAVAPVLYGGDPRPIDGIVQQIDVAGAEILVGGECGPSFVACNAIPEGVAALAAIIDDLVEQQENEVPSCKLTE